MSKLRKLIPLLTIVALALLAVPVSATPLPIAAIYFCIVYEGTELAGAGKTVEVFVGAETTARDSGVTDANSLVDLQFYPDDTELDEDVIFKVGGILATESVDVDVGDGLGGPIIDLSYTYIPGDVPDISVATSLAFGSVTVGTSKTKTLTISNSGDASLSITDIGVTGTQFSVGTCPGTIAAGGSANVDVTFSPTSTGTKSATLTITSNDPDEGSKTVALSGTGVTGAATFKSWLYETFVECLVD